MKKDSIVLTVCNIAIVILTAIAICQTYKAISLNAVQTEKMTLPVIVFDAVSTGDFILEPIIKNVGVGPAFNIQVNDYSHKDITAYFDIATALEKDGQIKLRYHISDSHEKLSDHLEDVANDFYRFISYRGEKNMSRSSQVNFDEYIYISYCDIKGNKYQISQKISYDIRRNQFAYIVIDFPMTIE